MDIEEARRKANEANQMLCWWCGVLFFVLFFVGTMAMMQFVPPPSPLLNGEELLAKYEDNLLLLRGGIIVCIFASALYVPWSVMVGFQLARLEGDFPVLSMSAVGAGFINAVAFLFPYVFWASVFYRPDRNPDAALLMNDMTWLEFVIVFSPFMVQLTCIGLIGLKFKGAQRVMPRWFAFLSLWAAILVTPGGLAVFFYEGPFAWNGILGFLHPAYRFYDLSHCLLRGVQEGYREPEVRHYGGRGLDERTVCACARPLSVREVCMANSVSDLLAQLPAVPDGDHSMFGEVDVQPLSKFQAIGGRFLSRNWVTIPHVTHHDDVDITAVEAARKQWNADNPDNRFTILFPVIGALVEALKEFPIFNSSLVDNGASIALKKYFNIGIAVDTPNGLLVPVLKGCDKRTKSDLRDELAELSQKAAGKGLSMDEMSGSSIAISSLGHIGGTGFTPIVNSPDVAIVGMTKVRETPVRGSDGGLEWKTVLPISLSYDHRVINGADAAKFVGRLGELINQQEFG